MLTAALHPPTHAAFSLSQGAGTQYVPGTSHGRLSPLVQRPTKRFQPDIISHVQAFPPGSTDVDLVAAMARRDERAAAALYDRHSAVMFGLALRMVGETADAEDVVLDAFSQAWRDAARYESSRGSVAGFSPFRIAVTASSR